MNILKIDNLSKKYKDIQVIDNFSMELHIHERIALSGPSGEGKTSLLNIILGINSFDGGSVLKGDKLHYLVVFQDDRLMPSFNALKNMDVYPSRFAKPLALDILDKLRLSDVGDKPACKYSGGMSRRLAIARALYGCLILHETKPDEPLLLVMDEPFKGLDDALKNNVIEYVDSVLTSTGATLLLVTHDKKEATALGCDFIKLNRQ